MAVLNESITLQTTPPKLEKSGRVVRKKTNIITRKSSLDRGFSREGSNLSSVTNELKLYCHGAFPT